VSEVGGGAERLGREEGADDVDDDASGFGAQARVVGARDESEDKVEGGGGSGGGAVRGSESAFLRSGGRFK
jgi:hypothetical protein